MFYTFIPSFDFVVSFLFAHSPTYFVLFAKGYKGTAKCAHNALSKKSIVSLKHCQKNYFAFAVSWHNWPTFWVEWILANQWQGVPGGCISVCQSAGTACTKAPLPPSSLVSTFLWVPNQKREIKSPFPCSLTSLSQGSTYSQALNITNKWTIPKPTPWPWLWTEHLFVDISLSTCTAVIPPRLISQSIPEIFSHPSSNLLNTSVRLMAHSHNLRSDLLCAYFTSRSVILKPGSTLVPLRKLLKNSTNITQQQNGQRTWTDVSTKIYKLSISIWKDAQ